MLDYLTLETTPTDETCVQVGEEGYYSRMMDEAHKYATMLRGRFVGFNKVSFGVKTFPHDFGTYAEVVVKYNDTDDIASAQALAVEDNLPRLWNDTTVVDWEIIKDDYLDKGDSIFDDWDVDVCSDEFADKDY